MSYSSNDEILKLAAIAHSKHRNMIGLVGIEVNTERKMVHVKIARQWSRTDINKIPNEITKLYRQVQWDDTFIDQLTGQHFIESLEDHPNNLPVSVITVQKNMKDPGGIERAIAMDKIEMTQLMMALRQAHMVIFPKNPTESMQELETQMGLYIEHKTESGTLDYYSPGDELDNLPKALLIACFAARQYLDSGYSEGVAASPINEKSDTYYGMMSSIGNSF